MKTFMRALGLVALFLSIAKSALIPNLKSHSWCGTSLYYLHGLSSADQDAYLSALSADGAKVVRVWVRGVTQGKCEKGSMIANGCDEFEDVIGEYNTYTLDLLDATIMKIESYGMKALISPHDANLLGSTGSDGKTVDVYGNTWGSGFMYTSPDAAEAYDNRLSAILNYTGAHSGRTWKHWTSAIMGFDLENEPMLLDEKYKLNDPAGWICARAAHIRSELGAENPIQIASGGVGGSYEYNANFASWVVSCPDLDVVSVHYYSDGGWTDHDFIAEGQGKLVLIEEWTTTQGDTQGEQYSSNVQQINELAIAWLIWQILPHQTCDASSDTDHSGLVIDGGIDVAGPMQATDATVASQDWTKAMLI